MKTKSSTRAIKREQQVKDGAYDGRFRTKVVTDKKKEKSKNGCKNIDPYDEYPSTNRQGI